MDHGEWTRRFVFGSWIPARLEGSVCIMGLGMAGITDRSLLTGRMLQRRRWRLVLLCRMAHRIRAHESANTSTKWRTDCGSLRYQEFLCVPTATSGTTRRAPGAGTKRWSAPRPRRHRLCLRFDGSFQGCREQFVSRASTPHGVPAGDRVRARRELVVDLEVQGESGGSAGHAEERRESDRREGSAIGEDQGCEDGSSQGAPHPQNAEPSQLDDRGWHEAVARGSDESLRQEGQQCGSRNREAGRFCPSRTQATGARDVASGGSGLVAAVTGSDGGSERQLS